MKRVIVGTAGHIDHGKTRLLEALTGIDCDRWAEEKERGITIDLGFAHLEERGPDGEELQIGFVDVPGHERFLHNALAGLGGIRIVLLVVAADEGVKPQTREHLAICSLLEIPHGLVVLTKRDLVDEDLLELAQLEVAELLEGTPLADAPLLPVSSTTGEGIDELRRALVELAASAEPLERDGQPFRLPIDRAFQLRGLGAIVTGTLISGQVASGDTLAVLPGGPSARVRSLQVHGQERKQALAGERTALQLAGVDLGGLERGEQLAEPGIFAETKDLCARFQLLPDAPEAIRSFVPIRFHLYASEVVGKLRPLGGGPLQPGESGLVEIRLSQPVVAVRGDRFILRRPSPAATLGGGEIVDPRWRRRRGQALHDALAAIEDRRSALELWVLETGERGATAAELAPRLGCRAAARAGEHDGLTRDGRLLAVESGRGRRWIAPAAVRRVVERARVALRDYFAAERLAHGMPKAQLLGQVLPARAGDLADVYLRWLTAEKVLVADGDQVNLPGRRATLSGDESELSRKLLRAIESAGLSPPSPGDLAAALGAKPQILEGVQRFLVGQGKLIRLPAGLLVSTAAIERLRQELVGSDWGEFTVPEFKDRYRLSRKWAIPLLEHLDSVNATRRVGDKRQIVRR
jgi:selenocysteine-specific elongation factor